MILGKTFISLLAAVLVACPCLHMGSGCACRCESGVQAADHHHDVHGCQHESAPNHQSPDQPSGDRPCNDCLCDGAVLVASVRADAPATDNQLNFRAFTAALDSSLLRRELRQSIESTFLHGCHFPPILSSSALCVLLELRLL